MKFRIERTTRRTPPVAEAELADPEETSKYRQVWIIELNSLEDLLGLSRRETELIIFDSPNEAYPSIEIYDDWRE